ncbi:MAG: hypothetical protein AB7S75_22320 [Desulfococcaceae bacterium]
MSSLQIAESQERVIKELAGLSLGKIDEVIDFIRFLKLKEDRENIGSGIISDETELIETEEDRHAYAVALQELETGNALDFDSLKSAWLQGQSANV